MKPVGFILLIVLNGCPPAFADEFLRQRLQERILFGENDEGTYFLQSFYSEDRDVVKLNVCGKKDRFGHHFPSHCPPLFTKELKYEDFKKYQNRLVEKLKDFRAKSIAKGSSEKEKNIVVLDQMIATIEQEGLGNWILEKSPSRGLAPRMNSNDFFQKVLKEMKSVFEEPIPNPTPKAVPSERGKASQGES